MGTIIPTPQKTHFTCAGCANTFTTMGNVPPLWRQYGYRLLCDDCIDDPSPDDPQNGCALGLPTARRSGHYITMLSGAQIDLAAPDYTNVRITDIAAGLARICRFGAQIEQFYSVAHHSVIGCHLLPKHMRYAWLMHDAHEAAMGVDLISPLKAILPQFQALEKRHEDALHRRFNVSNAYKDDVKMIDRIMLAAELIQLKGIKSEIAIREADLTGREWKVPQLAEAIAAIKDVMNHPRSFERPFLEYFYQYAPRSLRDEARAAA